MVAYISSITVISGGTDGPMLPAVKLRVRNLKKAAINRLRVYKWIIPTGPLEASNDYPVVKMSGEKCETIPHIFF